MITHVFIVLLVGSWCALTDARLQRLPGAIVEYHFDEGLSDPSATQTLDQVDGGASPGPLNVISSAGTSHWADESVGVRFDYSNVGGDTRGYSENSTLIGLENAIAASSDEWTFEIWARLGSINPGQIVALENYDFDTWTDDTQGECDASSNPNGFSMSYTGPSNNAHYFSFNVGASILPCQTTQTDSTQDYLFYAAVSFTATQVQIFFTFDSSYTIIVNPLSSPFTLDPESRLFLAKRFVSSVWRGTVYFIGIYDSALSFADASNNFQAFLPTNSPPYVPVTATTYDVGEDMLSLIHIPFVDLEGDASHVESGLLAPSQACGFEPDPFQIYIVSLPDPSRGTLYYNLNGVNTTITAADITLTSDGFPLPWGTGSVSYLPAANLWGPSAQTSFTYKVTDNQTMSDLGTISFSVFNTNDPPTAVNSTQAVIEAYASLVTLGGSDIDGTFSGVSYVKSLPSFGSLHQTSDGSTAGAEITASDVTAAGAQGVLVTDSQNRLIYISNPAAINENGLDTVLEDSFRFLVQDDGGLDSSNEGVIYLEVANHVRGTPIAHTGDEDVRTKIRLRGVSYRSDAVVDTLDMRIISLPSNGYLYQVGSDIPLTTTDLTNGGGFILLDVDSSSSTRHYVEYLPFQDLNGSPLDSFTYDVLVSGDTWYSAPAIQQVNVDPVNDAPVLSGPTGPIALIRTGDYYEFNVVLSDVDNPTNDFYCTISTDSNYVAKIQMSSAEDAADLDFQGGDWDFRSARIFEGSLVAINRSFTPLRARGYLVGSGYVQILVSDQDPDNPLEANHTIWFTTSKNSSSESTLYDIWLLILIYGILSCLPCSCCCFVLCGKYRKWRLLQQQMLDELEFGEESGST